MGRTPPSNLRKTSKVRMLRMAVATLGCLLPLAVASAPGTAVPSAKSCGRISVNVGPVEAKGVSCLEARAMSRLAMKKGGGRVFDFRCGSRFISYESGAAWRCKKGTKLVTWRVVT